jgi:hypothetical protein
MRKNLVKQFLNKIDTVKIVGEILEDFRELNQILFEFQGDFSLPGEKRLMEMPVKTDEKIKLLMGKISRNTRKLSRVLRKKVQVIPHDITRMDRAMIGIMNQYMTVSVNIQLDVQKSTFYANKLNEIHSSFKGLSNDLNNYNTFAKEKGWPELMSVNEASVEAKRLQPQAPI